jgi:hypothetical protein
MSMPSQPSSAAANDSALPLPAELIALPPLSLTVTRFHRTRLMQIWRSAGWPCQDGLEIDLLAAGLVTLQVAPGASSAQLKLTDAGIRTLAVARQRAVRALSAHDRLGQKFADQLLASGRIVWTELSLRAVVDGPQASAEAAPDTASVAAPEAAATDELPAESAESEPGSARPQTSAPTAPRSAALWSDDDGAHSAQPAPAARAAAQVWRMARPDLFSVRNTTVPAYLQPMVHEIKVSRADLLSDLRHAAKRQAYQWLCEECYYVFPAGIAEPHEIPEQFGIWVLHGSLESGHFELLRPARHTPCTLPFAVWMALGKATPLRRESDGAQGQLGSAEPDGTEDGAAATNLTDLAGGSSTLPVTPATDPHGTPP